MNAFDLNRKEYIRVNNNGGDPLTDFKKVNFLSSFVASGAILNLLPTDGNSADIYSANFEFMKVLKKYCTDYYSDSNGYACYIAELGVINNADDVNIPYAKVNIYAMDGRDVTA